MLREAPRLLGTFSDKADRPAKARWSFFGRQTLMHWKVKSAAFRVFSVVPFGNAIHHLLQCHVTHEWPRSETVLDELITAARDILEATGFSDELTKARFLEIGAGRDLAVALAFRMMGVGSVTTIDVERLAQISLINHTAHYLAQRLGTAVPVFRNYDDLAAFGVDYHAPMSLTEFADTGYDCFYSVDTLEHIPVASLSEILSAGKTRLKPGGAAVHIIDYSDHYARGTGSSRLNFLRYDDRSWERHNSKFMFMNRLRHSQYLKLFAEAGFQEIVDKPFKLDLDEYDIEKLDKKFQLLGLEDITTLHALIAAH
jgi:hypothetical protein